MIFATLPCSYVLHVQDANTITGNVRQEWGNLKILLTKTAENMPEADCKFKLTPEMQDFGRRMAHVIAFNMRTCCGGQRLNSH